MIKIVLPEPPDKDRKGRVIEISYSSFVTKDE